jgi:hypothetical protein
MVTEAVMTSFEDDPGPQTVTPDNRLERVLLSKCVEACIPDVHSRINHAQIKHSPAKSWCPQSSNVLKELKPTKSQRSTAVSNRDPQCAAGAIDTYAAHHNV